MKRSDRAPRRVGGRKGGVGAEGGGSGKGWNRTKREGRQNKRTRTGWDRMEGGEAPEKGAGTRRRSGRKFGATQGTGVWRRGQQ